MSGMGSWGSMGTEFRTFCHGLGYCCSGSTMSDYLRMNNTFAWKSPKLNGWQLMAQYSLDVLGTEAATFADNTRYLSGVWPIWKKV